MSRYSALLFVLPLLVWTSAANATVHPYLAFLDGPSESPPNASPGIGTGEFLYNDVNHMFTVDMSFSGLLGTTTASHIHAPTLSPFTSTANVATTTPTFAGFPLGVTSGVYHNVLDLTQASSWNPSYISANGNTTAGAEAAFIQAINDGKAYINIHTTVVPGGEIRGFLLTPEPTTCGLAMLGMAGIGCIARRRHS
jgi:hypothetical protein